MDKVPDSKTFWVFREKLIEKEVIEGFFTIFNETLDAAGVFAHEGKMVDASFVKADVKTKLIETYKVTDASTHDSQAIEELLTEKDEGQPFYADSAYTGEEQEKVYNCLLPWDKYVHLRKSQSHIKLSISLLKNGGGVKYDF